MRPLLLPALRRLWRDENTLQLGVDPARAVVLTNVDASTAAVLTLLDGRHTLTEITAQAANDGATPAAVGDLLALLAGCGAVVDGEPAAGLPHRLPPPARRRLGPDLATLSLTAGASAGRVLAARAARSVAIHVNGRIGPALAALLAASGIGRVHVRATGVVDGGDVCPGGLLPTDEHRPYACAAAEAIHRAAPEADTRPLGAHRLPDLVILGDGQHRLGPAGLSRELRRVPHLPVALRDGAAVIGPLVVPGQTACLECVELHRLDRDPVWPALAAQLRTGPPRPPDPSHLAVTAAAVGVAAMQVLCHLDGGEPEALGRSLEITGLGERLRRRSWAPHPRCDCANLVAGARP